MTSQHLWSFIDGWPDWFGYLKKYVIIVRGLVCKCMCCAYVGGGCSGVVIRLREFTHHMQSIKSINQFISQSINQLIILINLQNHIKTRNLQNIQLKSFYHKIGNTGINKRGRRVCTFKFN